MSDVTIDRLVLELPGVDAGAARALAHGIAEGLASAQIDGDYERLVVDIDRAEPAASQRLAAHIVQTILQRIG